jgi:hypothetical protein
VCACVRVSERGAMEINERREGEKEKRKAGE